MTEDEIIKAYKVIHQRKRDEKRAIRVASIQGKILETMYPEYEKVELFARKKREGWTAWGNQV